MSPCGVTPCGLAITRVWLARAVKMSLQTARPFSGMSVFKEGRMPQPDPTTSNVKFLLDDLSDEMRARINNFLWHPGNYSCTYQPKIKRLDVAGTMTQCGGLLFVYWTACPSGTFFNWHHSGSNPILHMERQTGIIPLLLEFHALYAESDVV